MQIQLTLCCQRKWKWKCRLLVAVGISVVVVVEESWLLDADAAFKDPCTCAQAMFDDGCLKAVA
jgi:hypothetical protein